MMSIKHNSIRPMIISCLQAKSTWADMEEGRNVFEEGNAFTMEALQQQLDQLSACQDFQVRSLVKSHCLQSKPGAP